MKISRALFAALGLVGFAAHTDAQPILYGAIGANAPGQLITINPATGATISTIGPTTGLFGGQSLNCGITGMAYNPVTGLLYGSTAGAGTNSTYNAATRMQLVTINTTTGAVTDIGPFNAGANTMADIAFTATGQLYGLGTAGPTVKLYSINLTTGAATALSA